MTLTLQVDGDRWRSHLIAVAEANPGLVPVAKGNGYGFGIGRLARRTQWLAQHGASGIDTLAVGTYDEVSEVIDRWSGDIVVLTPWRPFGPALETPSKRVIHTVSRAHDLTALVAHDPEAHFVVELATSMRRHGMDRSELDAVSSRVRVAGARCRGAALHLPLARGSHIGEVTRLLNVIIAAELPTRTLWVSHLTSRELAELRATWPDFTFRPRVGTDLWLGDRQALRVTATVLDVHRVLRGDLFGYRGRSAPRDGHLLIVSGGTAHGIGLEAPTGDLSIKSRAATLARGGLDAVGMVRSPYSIGGKQRLFAEPPHMQASMLFVPDGSPVPEVGDEIDVRVRFTATTFDRVLIE